jgi:hypothetical protein
VEKFDKFLCLKKMVQTSKTFIFLSWNFCVSKTYTFFCDYKNLSFYALPKFLKFFPVSENFKFFSSNFRQNSNFLFKFFPFQIFPLPNVDNSQFPQNFPKATKTTMIKNDSQSADSLRLIEKHAAAR